MDMPSTNERADERPTWSWVSGSVDRQGDHLTLWHGVIDEPIAVVGPPSDRVFPVEFLVTPDPADPAFPEAVEAVRRQLDYYLVELGEGDPWAYAIYHAGTGSNLYASVHWGWHPAGSATSE